MNRPKVFVTRAIPDHGLDVIKNFCDADVWTDELPPSRDVLLERVRGAEGIVSLLIDSEVLEAADPRLKVISNQAVGVTILTGILPEISQIQNVSQYLGPLAYWLECMCWGW